MRQRVVASDWEYLEYFAPASPGQLLIQARTSPRWGKPGGIQNGGVRLMIANATSSFNCPNCKALYRVVKVLPGPETVDRELTCRSCGAPLPARDSGLVLKYFMLRKAAHRQAWRELPARVSRVR